MLNIRDWTPLKRLSHGHFAESLSNYEYVPTLIHKTLLEEDIK